MRDLIRQQLSQVSYADLSHYDEATCTFNIPKYSKPKYDLEKEYLIELPGDFVNNTNSVIATNWNNCTAPSSKYLKIHVYKTMGKMIYVDSFVYDMSANKELFIMWSGWLPTEQIKQLGVF